MTAFKSLSATLLVLLALAPLGLLGGRLLAEDAPCGEYAKSTICEDGPGVSLVDDCRGILANGEPTNCTSKAYVEAEDNKYKCMGNALLTDKACVADRNEAGTPNYAICYVLFPCVYRERVAGIGRCTFGDQINGPTKALFKTIDCVPPGNP